MVFVAHILNTNLETLKSEGYSFDPSVEVMLHRDPASLSLISSRRPRMWSLTSPLMADRLAPILTMSIVISRISSCSVCSSRFCGVVFGGGTHWTATIATTRCSNHTCQTCRIRLKGAFESLIWWGMTDDPPVQPLAGWKIHQLICISGVVVQPAMLVGLNWRVWSLEVCFQCWEQGDMVIHFFDTHVHISPQNCPQSTSCDVRVHHGLQ